MGVNDSVHLGISLVTSDVPMSRLVFLGGGVSSNPLLGGVPDYQRKPSNSSV